MKEYMELDKRKNTHILKLKNRLEKAAKREAILVEALEEVFKTVGISHRDRILEYIEHTLQSYKGE